MKSENMTIPPFMSQMWRMPRKPRHENESYILCNSSTFLIDKFSESFCIFMHWPAKLTSDHKSQQVLFTNIIHTAFLCLAAPALFSILVLKHSHKSLCRASSQYTISFKPPISSSFPIHHFLCLHSQETLLATHFENALVDHKPVTWHRFNLWLFRETRVSGFVFRKVP